MYEVSFVTSAQELIDNPDKIVNMILRKETKKIVIPVYHMRKLEELQHSPDPKVAERARHVLRNVDTLRKMKKLEIRKGTGYRRGLIYLSMFMGLAFLVCFVVGLAFEKVGYLIPVGFAGIIASNILAAVSGAPSVSSGADMKLHSFDPDEDRIFPDYRTRPDLILALEPRGTFLYEFYGGED